MSCECDSELCRKKPPTIEIMPIGYFLVRAPGPWKEVWLSEGAGEGARGLYLRLVYGDKEWHSEECRRMIVKSLGYQGNNVRAKRKGKEGQPERERKNRSDSNLYLKRIHGKICIPHTIIVAIIANTMLELTSKARIWAINSFLSVAEHFINLYYSSDIKSTVYVPTVASTTPNCAAIPFCDAGILGSLLIHYATIGIRPMPLPPYEGISV